MLNTKVFKGFLIIHNMEKRINGVTPMINLSHHDRKERKYNTRFLVGTAIASACLLAFLGMGEIKQNRQHHKKLAEYSALPTTNIVVKSGNTIDQLTGNYVDMDEFIPNIRRTQFKRDNGIEGQTIYEHDSVTIRFDPKYKRK